MFENKLNQLIEIIKLEKEKMEKNHIYFAEDVIYEKVLKKYNELFNCLEHKNRLEIIDFLENLIAYLKFLINKSSNPNKITTTFELVIDKKVPEIEDAYELNEYFNIVFYLYNLFLNREFNRSDYLKYSFSLTNLDEILKQVKE